MSTDQNLPNLVVTEQTLRGWLPEYIEDHPYEDADPDLWRAQAFADAPTSVVGDPRELQRQRFDRQVHDYLKRRHGVRIHEEQTIDTDEDDNEVVESRRAYRTEIQMNFAEVNENWRAEMVRIGHDEMALRRRIQDWLDAHPSSRKTVDGVLDKLRRAVGE